MGDQQMATQDSTEAFKIGALVKVLNSGYGTARIVEFRGNLGPKGARIYRIRVRLKPSPAYLEVREDQLELVTK